MNAHAKPAARAPKTREWLDKFGNVECDAIDIANKVLAVKTVAEHFFQEMRATAKLGDCSLKTFLALGEHEIGFLDCYLEELVAETRRLKQAIYDIA